MTKLRTIATPGGARLTVADEHAARFEGLLRDLEAAGYAVKGDQSGGYNPRNIAGTNTPSHHAHGAAVDINWTDNPRGAAGKIDPTLARELAARHGLTWGGDWKNPDPMHFEVGKAPMPAISAPQAVADASNLPAGGQTQPVVALPSPDTQKPASGLLSGLFGASETESAQQAPTQTDLKPDDANPLYQQDMLELPQIVFPRLRPVRVSGPRLAMARAAIGRGRG